MPVSTNLAPPADKTAPSFIGVSSPDEKRKAIKITAKKAVIEISVFFKFALSEAKFLIEKPKVISMVIPKIN